MIAVGCRHDESDCRGSLSGCVYLFTDRGGGMPWIYGFPTSMITNPKRQQYKVPLPYGVTTLPGRPASVATYSGRTYICGWASYNLVLDEHHRMWKQGIRGPEEPPGISGADGTGAIGYLSWYDELTGERSPLSQGRVISTAVPRTWTLPSRPPDDIFLSDGKVQGGGVIMPKSFAAKTISLRPGDRVGFPDWGASTVYHLVTEVGTGGQFRTDLSGTIGGESSVVALPFTRVTHCELWLSVAGGLPQLVMRVPVGVTGVAESVATANLGESFIGAFERFPRCTMNAIWNDRQLMSGDAEAPDTVYLSDLFYPERYAGLNFRTRDGAPVTGILALRDYCLIFSRDRSYMLQGYTENDFSFTVLDQSLGSIGHNCNAVVHGSGYVWTEKGPYMFNGGWHPLSPDNAFTSPTVWGHPASSQSRATVDPESSCYMLVSDGHVQLFDRELGGSQVADVLVFDYQTVQPEAGGAFAPARVSLDTQPVTRLNKGVAANNGDWLYYYVANKWGEGWVHSMTSNDPKTDDVGMERQSFLVYRHRRITEGEGSIYGATGFVVWGDGSLTTMIPPYSPTQPNFLVRLGHYYFDEPGGSIMEGKTFKRMWVDAYAMNPVVTIYPGDADVQQAVIRGSTDAGITLTGQANYPYNYFFLDLDTMETVQTVAASGPVMKLTLDRVSGRGLSLQFSAAELGGGWASFQGFGGAFIDGPATRYGSVTGHSPLPGW